MNARRLTTTLGALALGAAVIGLGPAWAQSGTANPGGTTPGGMNSGTTNPGPMNSGTMQRENMPPGGAGNTQMHPGMNGGTGMGNHQTMNREHHPSMRSHASRGTYGHNRTTAREGSQAQNPEVDRLNDESLNAARRHQTYTPTQQQ